MVASDISFGRYLSSTVSKIVMENPGTFLFFLFFFILTE